MIDTGAEAARTGRPKRINIAHAGDSRAVLCRSGKAEELTDDHKPELPGETRRIERAGGRVTLSGPCHRIDGWGLNLSRALGDFHYKATDHLAPECQKVIAMPEVGFVDVAEEDEFLLLGCDGVFELLTSQEVVDVIRQQFQAGKGVKDTVEHLLDKCISTNLSETRGRGGDNCSAIL